MFTVRTYRTRTTCHRSHYVALRHTYLHVDYCVHCVYQLHESWRQPSDVRSSNVLSLSAHCPMTFTPNPNFPKGQLTFDNSVL